MGDSHRPVRYEHEPCNVSGGAVHLIHSTERKIWAAVRLVRCVRDEGLQKLEDALKHDDIYQAMAIYADCIGKLENALLVLDPRSAVYDAELVAIINEHVDIARSLRGAINMTVLEYSLGVQKRLSGDR
jgi:hypothetical protein